MQSQNSNDIFELITPAVKQDEALGKTLFDYVFNQRHSLIFLRCSGCPRAPVSCCD